MRKVIQSMLEARNVTTWLALMLALGCALTPVWLTATPPLLDYHNHLARQYILSRIDGSSYLSDWYVVAWYASPYLAFDALVQTLAIVFPVDVAGKVFLSLMLLLLGIAPLALSFALFGRVTVFSLLGLLFVYNETVTLGFVNYIFGIALGLCLLALWIARRERRARVRLVLFSVLCTLVFFSHLHGFAIYMLLVGSYEFGQYIRNARHNHSPSRWRLNARQRVSLLLIGLQCGLPLLIFFLFGPSTEIASRNTHGGIERKLSLLWGIFDYLIPPYLWSLDSLTQVALPIAIVLLIVTGRARIDPRMHLPLVSMLVLFFLMPMELFGAWGTDHRLLPALGILLAGSLRPSDSLERAAIRPILFIVVAAMVVLRFSAVTLEWRKSDATYLEYWKAFEVVPDGSMFYYAFGHAAGKRLGNRPVYHLPTLVLSSRDVYVPYLFASSSGTFTLQYQPKVEPLQRFSQGPVLLNGESPNWSAIANQFDYFLLVNEEHFRVPRPTNITLVFEGQSIRLYRRAVNVTPY